MGRSGSPLRGRMIFNLGARRSGTYWLQRVVAAHPLVAPVPSETHLISHGIAPLLEHFQHDERSDPTVGLVFADRERLLDAIRDLCDTVFSEFLEPGTEYVAERSPLHALHLPLLAEIYPDARVVHIIRDGRDVARSMIAQPWRRGPKTISDAAREWRDTVSAARSAGLPASRYREVRYERMLVDAEAEIRALFDWLGLPETDDALARALEEAGREANTDPRRGGGAASQKWQSAFSANDLAAFDEAAGDLLTDLGYEPPGPGWQPAAV